MSEESSNGVSEDEIRRELQRVLDSPLFESSERNRKFLQHVVEETLAGRADRIKAYSIATLVFGRGDDFNPMQDSIVRIEAARLRRDLEHFYLKQGEEAGLRISIPKGGYVPQFEIEGLEADDGGSVSVGPSEAKILHQLGPRVLIPNFELVGVCEVYPGIGRKLTHELISALTRFTEIFVYGFATSDVLSHEQVCESEPCNLAVDYKLFGTVTASDNTLRVDVLLMRCHDGRYIWAYDVEREFGSEANPSQFVGMCREIAGQVARKVAERDGVMDSEARDSCGNAPLQFEGYQKILDFQDYWRNLNPDRFEPLRQELENTISVDPNFAEAHACLSMLYSNAVRYGYDVGAKNSSAMERAFALARRAIQLAPNSSRSYHALGIAEWFSGKPTESLETLATARSLNPNDSELMAEVGLRHAQRMEWDTAIPLIVESYIRNPLQTGAYRMGLVLNHFAEFRYEQALEETDVINAPRISYVHIAAAAALSKLGRRCEARERLRKAEQFDPGLDRILEERLVSLQLHPDLIAAITDAIYDADPLWRRKRDGRSLVAV